MRYEFMNDNILLYSAEARRIYEEIKDLPVIDYHCHLNEREIAENIALNDIGEIWLSADHYKWRAMRACGVREEYITGKASYRDKFMKFAEILPELAGNPLYYWAHIELKQLFGIEEELNAKSAERIYREANHLLSGMRVDDLLAKYRVEYIATTDDPVSSLSFHGSHRGVTVAPTFRPDKALNLDCAYLNKLGTTAKTVINSLDNLKDALCERLDYFSAKGCAISDHGFERFPRRYASESEAYRLFSRREELTSEEKDALRGYLLTFLAKEYGRRDMIMQLHFSVLRNVNREMAGIGADSGFDVIDKPQSACDMIEFFNSVSDSERPMTLLYTLNDANLAEIAAVTCAFRKVKMGAAWWFNDTAQGIRKNLSVMAEYSALGASYGMLTDSRSFFSYARFDFFRRILAEYLGDMAVKGELAERNAIRIAKNISYYNIKGALKL